MREEEDEEPEDEEKEQLRAELAGMKLGELKKRARAAGVDAEAIDAATPATARPAPVPRCADRMADRQMSHSSFYNVRRDMGSAFSGREVEGPHQGPPHGGSERATPAGVYSILPAATLDA